MLEDKLSRDERIRLEAIAQSNARLQVMSVRAGAVNPEYVIALAVDIEHYIRTGETSKASKA